MHVSLVEYKKTNNMYKKLFERSILVCQLENKNRDTDTVFNFFNKIAYQHANFTVGCPIDPTSYSLRNYKFNSKLFPPLLRIENMNVTAKADFCSGKRWKPKDTSCFINLLFRVRYLN